MDDIMKLKGSVTAVLRGPDGRVKKWGKVDNLIVTAGKNFAASWWNSVPTTKFMPYMGIGTSNQVPAAGDSALIAQVARVVGTISANNNIYTHVAVFGAGVGTGTIQEAGLFSVDTNGTMFSRALVGPYAKDALDTLTLTWNVTLG